MTGVSSGDDRTTTSTVRKFDKGAHNPNSSFGSTMLVRPVRTS